MPAATASAQENTPAAEVFGGYALLSTDGESLSGWLASGSVTIVRWLGVEAEIGDNDEHLMAAVGPRFTGRGRQATAFAHLLIGTERLYSDYTFSVDFGGGVDVWVTRGIAVRAGVDGRGTWWEEERFGSVRFQAGMVVALGSR
jgi:hypothetical protein